MTTPPTRSPGRPKLDEGAGFIKRFVFTLTREQHAFLIRQGGGAWIRDYIDRSLKKKNG